MSALCYSEQKKKKKKGGNMCPYCATGAIDDKGIVMPTCPIKGRPRKVQSYLQSVTVHCIRAIPCKAAVKYQSVRLLDETSKFTSVVCAVRQQTLGLFLFNDICISCYNDHYGCMQEV